MGLDLPLELERVFAFFAEAGSLQRITPPELDFRILTPLPIEIRKGTRVRDVVRYRLPLSPLGDVVHPLVRRQVAGIFAYRERAVAEALL